MYKSHHIDNVLFNFFKIKKRLSISLNSFFIVFLSFIFLIYLCGDIKFIHGQMMLDTFVAQGTIGSKISYDKQPENQISPKTESITNIFKDRFFKNNNTNTYLDDKLSKIGTLQGSWNLAVINGDVDSFITIFSLANKEGKIVNAFAINNFTNTNYIQINEKATEIINGKASLASLGLINSTQNNLDVIIILAGLKITIILDEINSNKYFNGEPINGFTSALIDGTGRYLIGQPSVTTIPQPQQNVPPTPQPQQNVPPIPQQNTPIPQPRQNVPIPQP